MKEWALFGLGGSAFAVAAVLTLHGTQPPAPTPAPAPAVASIASPPPAPVDDPPAATQQEPVPAAPPEAVADDVPQSFVYECIQGSTTTLTDSPCPPGAESRRIALREPNSYVPTSPDLQYQPGQMPADSYGADAEAPDTGGVYGVYGWRHRVPLHRQPLQRNTHPAPAPPHRSVPAYRSH